MVRDPHSGKYRRTRLFVLTLGYSRKSVRLLVFRSSSQTWAELHEKAFRRLGGVTRVVVLDNLREGVLKPDIYDPTVNPLYRDVLAHYGVVALPCRVRDPDRKGKVESGVGHAQKTPLKGQASKAWKRRRPIWITGKSAGPTRASTAPPNGRWRPCSPKSGPRCSRLPLEPFRYYQYGERTVHLDGCVEVDAAYYGAPPGWIGRQVQVQWDHRHVRLLIPQTGELLREHLRQVRGGIASATRTAPNKRRRGRNNCWRAPTKAGRRSARSAAGMHRSRRASRRAPHPGRAVAGQEVWRGDGGRCLRRRPGSRRARVPLRAPLSGAQSATAAELAPSRSTHPRTHEYTAISSKTKPRRTNHEPH
jgi:hypothetical protein